MKGKKKVTVKNKRSRIIKYSAFTVLLTCLIVAGYYLVSNGVIFGKYFAKSPYIDEKYINNPSLTESEAEAKPDLTITAKNAGTPTKTLAKTDEGELIEYLGFREKESYTGATTFSGNREIYFNLGNKLKIGDLYTTIEVATVNKDAELTLHAAEFVKAVGDESGKRPVSIFSSNETPATKDKVSSRVNQWWDTDGSVTFTTKGNGMRFYIDGSKKEPIDLKEYGYLKLVVDSQSEVMVSGYKSLPTVPETDGTVQKGTKGNPLIILEIVPDMMHQSLGFLTSSQEEGLPIDPLEFSYEIMKKNSNVKFYQSNPQNMGDNVFAIKDDVITGNDVKSWDPTNLQQLGGWLDNNNGGYEIYNPDGTVVGASRKTKNEDDRVAASLYYLGTYRTVEIRKDKSFASQILNGQSKKPIAEIQAAYPDLFVDKDGQAIDPKYLTSDKQWAWSFEKDPEDNNEYTVDVTSDASFAQDLQKYKNKEITFTELAASHPDLFKTTSDGKEILEKEIQRADCWKLEKEESQIEGYYVCVGEEEGEFAVNSDWDIGRKNNNTDKWKYYPTKEEIPEKYNYKEIWPEDKYDWQMKDVWGTVEIGGGFPASRLTSRTTHPVTNEPFKTKATVKFRYKYDGYIFRFELIGVKFNDILKRMLFYYEDDIGSDDKVIMSADDKYDETYVKVITLTPAMINQMDADDTAGTLDYIERADMFYISSYREGDNSVSAMRSLYDNYVDVARDKYTTQTKAPSGELVTFHENDLEWVDCMKIIKRLSADSSLPMFFSSTIGSLLDEGVTRDKEKNTHMYVDSGLKCTKRPGSLNNISKLYLICTQFELSASKDKPNNDIEYVSTFMDDIYDKIRQVPLQSDNERVSGSAKYTGYYQRPNLCDCTSVGETEKQKVYYLWNLFTFWPDVPVSPEEDALFDSGHNSLKVENLWKYGFLRSTFSDELGGMDTYLNSYNKGGSSAMGVVAGTTDPDLDYQNVVVGQEEGTRINNNFTPFGNGVFNRLGRIFYKILNNGTPLTPKMTFGVLNTKESRKYYQKISNDSVLIDYEQSAQYKNDKTLYLHCKLQNTDNDETSIITSISFVNPDTDDKIVVTPQKLDGTALEKKEVDFSKHQNVYAKITGYEVSKNDSLQFALPFSLKKWRQGYTVIRVDWVARTSKIKGTTYTPYQNPNDPTNATQVEVAKQYAEVDIGQRGLFVLQ
ncbi:MAG: hypothetical protein NC293_12705 [Roseburia sp.]|nr:hypothetical protein [Roseburia sp.]